MLELERCPDCDAVVSADALTCPRCGGSFASRGQKVMRTIFIVLALLAAAGMILPFLF